MAPDAATAEPVAAALGRIEAVVLELRAEVADLRKQVTDGKPREWLSINACAKRFNVTRKAVLAAIDSELVVSRVKPSRGGWPMREVTIVSARAAFGPEPAVPR